MSSHIAKRKYDKGLQSYYLLRSFCFPYRELWCLDRPHTWLYRQNNLSLWSQDYNILDVDVKVKWVHYEI